jgi:hypothetical protein
MNLHFLLSKAKRELKNQINSEGISLEWETDFTAVKSFTFPVFVNIHYVEVGTGDFPNPWSNDDDDDDDDDITYL